MFDLHMHTIHSDGELLPSELARRYEVNGFKAIAITDHADFSNLKSLVVSIVDFCNAWPKGRIKVIPGVELTHLPLEQFKPAASYARKKGIKIIVAHGCTPVEPVIEGTARAAIQAGIDILSHPGYINEEDVLLAAKNSVMLEITARKGHGLGNAHVAKAALKLGAHICINSDAHTPGDISTPDSLRKVGLDAGLAEEDIAAAIRYIETLIVKFN
jgi:putative hydrolase